MKQQFKKASKRKRKYLSGTVRKAIWLKFKKRCQICKAMTTLFRPREWSPVKVAHIDHITPISKGGACTEENFRLLCETCNLSIQASQNDANSRGLIYAQN